MTSVDERAGESERATALEGWVAAFDREVDERGDFAAGVAAVTAHGCFDVRAVVERWVLANPTGQAPPAPPAPPAPSHEPADALSAPEPAAMPDEPVVAAAPAPEPLPLDRRSSPRAEGASSPDVAYFHSLLQGGIDRAQIDEAFPAFGPVIDEAVAQHEAAAPILSDVPAAPTREDLNDEIRGMRQALQGPATRGRRRWRDRG